jgi:hypothetical protein
MGMVAHIYNPSYMGSRNQEDHGLRPGKKLEDLISTNSWEWWQMSAIPTTLEI